MRALLTFIVICMVCCKSYQQETKIWIPNTNYDDPNNWLDQKLPCETSKIVFPQDLNAAIYLPSNVKVKEIQLSNDGELILKPDGIIDILNSKNEQTCDRKVALFKKINIEPWLKSTNWKLQTKNHENIAIPHTERVPCIYDNAVFPKESSFWIQYPEISLSVNSFTIEGQNLTDDKLQDFLLSEPGSRQFKNLDYQQRTDVISVKNIKCTDKSGCLCHENEIFILSAVCNNLKHICNVTHCLNPIKPVGHCCEICGAHLLLKFDTNNFEINKFRERVNQYLFVSGYNSINIHVSKVLYKDDTHIQVVIIEKDFAYKGDSVSAATSLHEKLLSDLKKFKILSSELKIAGPEYWPDVKLKTTIGIVLGTLFAVLLFVLIVYVRYGPLEDKKFSLPNLSNFRPLLFVRFENTGDNDTGGLEFRNRSVASSLFNLDRAFDNPLYGEEPGPSTTENADENVKEIQDIKNPVYSDLQKQDSDEE